MIRTIPVTSSNWTSLSAVYPYDHNINFLYDDIVWEDGYDGNIQEIFKSNVDFSVNKNTLFYLSSSKNLFDFIQEIPLDDTEFGAYVTLGVNTEHFTPSYRYVSVKDDNLYLASLSSNNSFFRLIMNSDDTFSLLNRNLYVTIDEKNMFSLVMQPKLEKNDLYKQKFKWYNNEEKIYISTSSPRERFWSYSKSGPEKGKVRANGLEVDGLYREDMYKIPSNRILFDIYNFITTFTPTGFTENHKFVRYFNEYNSKNNKNVETKNSENININYLIDSPYNSSIDKNKKLININLANLKNFKTSEYRYNVK